MDFADTLRRLAVFLEAEDMAWAVVGGLALAAHGAGRLTNDLDIATESRSQGELVAFLEGLGYETLHLSAGYSNHLHANRAFGRVDAVYVSGETSRLLFSGAGQEELFDGVVVPVACPEHLVAMKVLAAKNDPTRRLQEWADISALLRANSIEPEAVRGYFERHDLLDAWEEIRAGF